MKRLSVFIIILFAQIMGTFIVGKQGMGIKKFMSKEEFMKCGLDKLSANELNNLNKWLSKISGNLEFFQKGDCVEKSIKFAEDNLIGLDDGTIWKTFRHLSISWSTYDNVILYGNKMINLDEEEMVDVTKISSTMNNKPFSKQTMVKGIYSGIENKHWIKKVEDFGKIIILEDNSVWEINIFDRINTSLWLPVSNITVVLNDNPLLGYNYLLLNTNDGEKAEAKYLGKKQ